MSTSTGKVLIVGGTSGIGAKVHELLNWGDTPFVPEISELDVNDSWSIESYVVEDGPFDGIVYSAGINNLKWIADLNPSDLTRSMQINALGLALIAAEHERAWPEANVRCVAVVSDAHDRAMRGSMAYCASKAALMSIVRTMARELAPRWVTVAVSPGVVDDTPMTKHMDATIPDFRNWTPEQARQYENQGSTMGRRVTRGEVAEAVLYALKGSPMLNGSNITINGGK